MVPDWLPKGEWAASAVPAELEEVEEVGVVLVVERLLGYLLLVDYLASAVDQAGPSCYRP